MGSKEESPRKENDGVCPNAVVEPCLRARDLRGSCKRRLPATRYCKNALSLGAASYFEAHLSLLL